jgi:DNA-directed RNA polymerase specialized sigma24 family protein
VLGDIPEQSSEAAASEWESEWQRNLLKAALERVRRHVKEEQFQIFDLYVVREWPVKRVTQALGVSPARVYLAKHRITLLIRREVRRLEKGWARG